MEVGFIVDHGHAGAASLSKWTKGDPQQNLLGGIKVKNAMLNVMTHRCIGCGYLESYAK